MNGAVRVLLGFLLGFNLMFLDLGGSMRPKTLNPKPYTKKVIEIPSYLVQVALDIGNRRETGRCLLRTPIAGPCGHRVPPHASTWHAHAPIRLMISILHYHS